MLAQIHVENFALMEDVQCTFAHGLTIFSGETGAGKSMLIDALGILLGGRASSEFIRHGMERAFVEGIFEDCPESVCQRLEEAGYSLEDGQLIISREINRNGRNICRLQGRTVPLSLYRNLVQGLVDIHGQMEHQSLFNPDTHRGLLDAFGGEEQISLVEEVNQAARTYRKLIQKEEELIRKSAERERREDILRYQIEEIEQINPQPKEEEELEREKKRLLNSEKIMGLTTEIHDNLYSSGEGPSVVDLLGICRKNLLELSRLDNELSQYIEPLESAYYTIEDIAREIASYQESFDYEPGRLDQIEERLIQLQRLRKYGKNIEEILATKEEMVQELHSITNLQSELTSLRQKIENSYEEFQDKAQKLSGKRIKIGEQLAKGLQEELMDLGLEKSKFEVRYTPVNEPQIGGLENVEFYFSANLGEPPKPLAKVASGGEMSRLMLALKSLLAKIEDVGTFVFDEVDSGVGGRTIQKVGEKLAKIAESKQVFCITHAAQVAAFGDEHFGIYKEIIGERTRTQVQLLNTEERIEELARMLGGSEDKIALEHARKLWKNVQN
ncbi:MAG: DNA repair protein RecN [Desulfitobacterium sp.]|nr:DNA repair protein RecN [Desulfitobacterium sp.]